MPKEIDNRSAVVNPHGVARFPNGEEVKSFLAKYDRSALVNRMDQVAEEWFAAGKYVFMSIMSFM